MKRTKLPSSASLHPGSLPPSSAWYEVPRCFACDDPIKSHRFSTSLLLGHTQYSHSSIPGKLGEYIGDGFVVVVTSEDTLCRNCMNLLNTMDRLEEELKEHRTKLVGNLRRKYGLDPGGNQVAAKPISNRKQQSHVYDDDDVIEIQSDEEWTPYNKKRKAPPSNTSRSKTLCCNVCKMEFTDLSQFMTHLKQHKEQNKVESDTSKSFKCGCCTLSFDKKEALAIHMRLHTGEKQHNRPTPTPPPATETVSLLKGNYSTSTNNGNKLYPKPTSRTVVEMKLIMDAAQKTSSNIPTKDSSHLEKPVTVTKVAEKDSGGKVCLLALWNSGSCTDHADCQNPSCLPEGHLSNSQVAVTQEEMFIPRIIVKQTQDGVPDVVVSQSQSQFQIGASSSMGSQVVSNISHANKQFASIPHSVNAPVQMAVNTSGEALSQIVVSVPNQSNSNYQILNQQDSGILKEKSTLSLNPNINKDVITLSTSDGDSSNMLTIAKQDSDVDQKTGVIQNDNLNEQSSQAFQTEAQLSNKNLDEILNSVVTTSDPGKGNKSMPLLDDIVPAVSSERTIIEQDEMGNIAIVNVTSVEQNEPGYSAKDNETDWFYASEQSNAALEASQGHELWGNQDSVKSSIAGIDQVDGMRSSSTLPFEVKEQSDSVDEDEKSEYFTSRYAVDTEKLRQDAEALADALLAAIKS